MHGDKRSKVRSGLASSARHWAHKLRHGDIPSAIAEDVAIIKQSDLFDRNAYLQRNPDVAASGMDPVEHYVAHGAIEGRNPGPGFDTAFYLKSNPDVRDAGMNPLRHYIEHGQAEGRWPYSAAKNQQSRPSKTREEKACEAIAVSGLFDASWYLGQRPGVAGSGMDPVLHYVKYGASEYTNPNAVFDTRYYLDSNPDVAASDLNPLYHFCTHGRYELRNPSAGFDIGWYWITRLAETDASADPLAHYLTHGAIGGEAVRTVGTLTEEDKAAGLEICQRLLEREGLGAITAARLGILLTHWQCWAEAERALRLAVSMDWKHARNHARLARVLARQGKWWQAVEHWQAAVAIKPNRADWQFNLGAAQEKMNRFAEAAAAYGEALTIQPGNAQWHYLMGYMYEKAGSVEKAAAAYADAVRLDERKDVKHFGIGVFHQARGYWPEAAEAYASELTDKPWLAELHYRLGMANDRCYRWDEALAAYHVAISLEPASHPYWHYRYGFVLERLERWEQAAQAYAAAASLQSERASYWRYRQGYVLTLAGEYEQACLAYIATRSDQTLYGGEYQIDGEASQQVTALDAYFAKFDSESLIRQAIAADYTKADGHYCLGEFLERKQDWEGAARAYADAVARNGTYRPQWYYRLGFVLFRSGDLEAACASFRETYPFRLPYGVDTSAYSKSQTVCQNMQYREHLEALPIKSRTIFYESTHGATLGGNPYAIFKYLLAQKGYSDWTHIWAVTPDTAVPDEIRTQSNVILADHGSDLYRRYIATASHLVNDSTFPYWFSRRPEQKYLNTWHGTPLKMLGKSMRGGEDILPHRNIQRNLLHATHVVSPNVHTSNVLMDDFDVRGIYGGKLAETGYPRIDQTLNASSERIATIRAQLHLDDMSPIVFYAPTWRGAFGQPEVDLEQLRTDLTQLAKLPCQWVFRGHPFSEQLLRDCGLPVTIAPSEIDTSDLLAISDILVTDYSSIFFDFLPTRRPIFYYCYDLEEYSRDRGMYFNIHDMPGTVCTDMDFLFSSLRKQLINASTDATGYEEALQKFCPHEDGCATARTFEFFFNDDDTHVVDRYQNARPSLLFFGGHFAPNGISASFLNVMTALQESEECQLSVAVEPLRIRREPVWRARFRQLPSDVIALGRVGRMVTDAEQAWVAARFRSRRTFPSDAMREVFASAYSDEYRRCFGDARIDVVVDFDGYNGFWSALFGLGAGGRRNLCWLHSDFFEEFLLRYPNLQSQFEFFPSYDSLVSVSKSVNEANRNHLLAHPGMASDQFTFCNNLIGVESISKRSLDPLPEAISDWLGDSTVIGTLARLSPEKDHRKLINAFHQVVEKSDDDLRLVIAGDGPLRDKLQSQINELKLQDRVYLVGQLTNPYPLLKRLDIFAFSSNYEGQGIAILEALVLGKRIVSTDVVGPRTILDGGYGLLVENSVNGLADGLMRALQGKVQYRRFDSRAYENLALKMLKSVIFQAAPV